MVIGLTISEVVLMTHAMGKVASISYTSTVVESLYGEVITFQNSQLFTKNYKNLTRNHGYVLAAIPFGVAYGSNLTPKELKITRKINSCNPCINRPCSMRSRGDFFVFRIIRSGRSSGGTSSWSSRCGRKNKIIILTEELIKIIGLNDEELFYQIIFFLSNYGENAKRCSEIFRNNSLLISIKEYANKIINDQKKSNNLFFLIENGFNTGDINCKEIIINNFTYFIKERIKVLSDLTNNDKYASHFNKKCQLLLAFLMFLENNIGKYSKIIDNIIFFLQRDNFEEYLIKVQTNSKNYNQEIIGCLLSKLKTKPKEI